MGILKDKDSKGDAKLDELIREIRSLTRCRAS